MQNNMETHAFQQLIKDSWMVMKTYNSSGIDSAIYALAQLKENIDTLIHHLKNKKVG